MISTAEAELRERVSTLERENLLLTDANHALSDRLLYVEAALHHIADRVDMKLAGLPDPLDIGIFSPHESEVPL